MVPFLPQSLEVVMTKSTPESAGQFLSVRAFDMLVQHRFEMEDFIAIHTRQRFVLIVILHVLCDHFLRIELSLAQIALEVCCAMDFLVLGKVAGIAEAFVAERAFV